MPPISILHSVWNNILKFIKSFFLQAGNKNRANKYFYEKSKKYQIVCYICIYIYNIIIV